MAKIRHIAIFSENPTKLAAFYGEVYGMRVTGTDALGNAWVTDGYMDVALLRRRNEKSPPAGIHHWGFTIEPAARESVLQRMKQYGVEPYSPYVDAPDAHRPYAEDAVKDPDGNRFDLSTRMLAVRTADGSSGIAAAAEHSALIRHIAIFSENPARLAHFYSDVFGMTVTGGSQGDVWVTDGHVDMALLSRKNAKAPKPGIHHWGFTLAADAKPGIYKALTERGCKPTDPRAEDPTIDRPFVEEKSSDPDGNRYDLTLAKREMDVEKARTRARLAELQPAK